MIELLIAIAILLVGIVAVAQLVPTAVEFNFRNRYDSSALIVAQRQLEQIIAQRLTVRTNPALPDYNFTDADGFEVYLGALPGAATPSVGGCPVAAGSGAIDFTVPCALAGYRKIIPFADYIYEVRWQVITAYSSNRPYAKRIILAARGIGARLFPPASLSVLVY